MTQKKNVKESCSVSIVFNVSWLNQNLEVTVVLGKAKRRGVPGKTKSRSVLSTSWQILFFFHASVSLDGHKVQRVNPR